MKRKENVREAIESLLEDTNPYDPGDVETALDSIASTLNRALLRRGKFRFLPQPGLDDVLRRLKERGFPTDDALDTYNHIKEILDENAYPEDEEIQDVSDIEEHLSNFGAALSSLLDWHEQT
jgi:hypothetical protein